MDGHTVLTFVTVGGNVKKVFRKLHLQPQSKRLISLTVKGSMLHLNGFGGFTFGYGEYKQDL